MGRRADDGKRVEWIQRLRRRDTSGLTVATFCEWEGVSVAAFVTVLHDYIRGVGVPRQWRRVTERRLTLRFVFSGSPADAEPGSIGVGRRHHAVLRSGRCVWIRGASSGTYHLLGSAGTHHRRRQRPRHSSSAFSRRHHSSVRHSP